MYSESVSDACDSIYQTKVAVHRRYESRGHANEASRVSAPSPKFAKRSNTFNITTPSTISSPPLVDILVQAVSLDNAICPFVSG